MAGRTFFPPMAEGGAEGGMELALIGLRDRGILIRDQTSKSDEYGKTGVKAGSENGSRTNQTQKGSVQNLSTF